MPADFGSLSRLVVMASLLTAAGEAQRVDSWWEEPLLFSTVRGKEKTLQHHTRESVRLDVTDKVNGDFSLLYTAHGEAAFGFTAGHGTWNLGPSSSARWWMKASSGSSWRAGLADSAGRTATTSLPDFHADEAWHEVTLPFRVLSAEPGFDFASVAALRIEASLAAGDRIWFDDVRFTGPNGEIGVTDKTVAQRMAEEKESRARRVQAAFEAGVGTDFSGRDRQLMDQLWLGRNVTEANRELLTYYQTEIKSTRENRADLWNLFANARLIFAYYQLGSHGRFQPPRLQPETERALLELLWLRTEHKNDIALARQSTWWMTGSENHDLNAKATSLVSSRIFMEEPEYRARIYPDSGHGGGYGYWFHQMYGQDIGPGPEGRAQLADGKPHNAHDHYVAWDRFLKEYFAERSRRGFFLERAAPGYMKYTLSYIQLIYDYSGDEELRRLARQFLDVVWADWAQEQIAGVRGGPKTRHHGIVGGYDSMTDFATFYLGGPGRTSFLYNLQLVSDYAWPEVLWQLALDREGLGSFANVSRGIGEEETTRPRPPGAERTMLGNRESRFLKYSWVTPDYILGTQMDHPDAVYNHLSAAGRWHGLITSASPEARVVFTGGPPASGPVRPGAADMELMLSTVQDRNVLIVQQARRWTQINPDWYPARDQYNKPVEVWLGSAWDAVEEQSGWVFARAANAYAAVRVVVEDGGPGYQWNAARTAIRLDDKFSPVVLEAGRRADYPSPADFQSAVLTAPLRLLKTVVPGFFMLSYRDILYNAANPSIPTVAGKPVNYTPLKVFDSPFLSSDFGSGVITVRKGADRRVYTFPPPTR